MLKVFAPLLGKFNGQGQIIDGTEVTFRLSGFEALENVAYSFRAEVVSQETGNHLLNAFLVMALNEKEELELQFYDTREHVHTFHWVKDDGATTSLEKHLFCFEGTRDRGSPVRISFQIHSAQECVVKFESKGKAGTWRAHWCITLARQMDTVATLQSLRVA